MFKNKNKNKSKLLVLSCLVSTPVTAIHSAAPQTDDLFFSASAFSGLPFSSFLPSLLRKVTFFLLCASGLQCLGLSLSAMCKCAGHEGQGYKTQPFPSQGALFC